MNETSKPIDLDEFRRSRLVAALPDMTRYQRSVEEVIIADHVTGGESSAAVDVSWLRAIARAVDPTQG